MSRSRVMCKVVVLLPLAMASVIAQSCSLIGNPGCACELDVSGGVIDLSSIGFQNGTPRFPFVFTNDGTVSYNPCYPYTNSYAPQICHDVAGCVMLATGEFYSLGTQDTAVFTIYFNYIDIHYSGGTGGRGMLVSLVCQPDATTPDFTYRGLQGNTYQFELVTQCACPDVCHSSSSGESDGGDNVGIVGIILILLLIFGFALYFGIGITWRKTKLQAEGWDVIPNKEFWQDLPYLIKDGCIFTVQPIIYSVKRLRGESEEKEPIVGKDDDQSSYNYGT